MFEKSAAFYDALYSWKDYAGEAAKICSVVQQHCPGARTLLDVACGTGKHLELLREHYEVEGVDLDPEMLRTAAERNPDVPLHEGDMISLDLGRTFDVVTCLFSSIAYAETPDRLHLATQRMATQVAAGGVLIVEPFFGPKEFRPGQPWALFVDEPDLKIARMDVPATEGCVGVITFHYLVGRAEGIEHFTEKHRLGLFTDHQYREALTTAGLELLPEADLMGRGLYIARKPVRGS